MLRLAAFADEISPDLDVQIATSALAESFLGLGVQHLMRFA
jgi:hypothetical protein